MKKVWIRLGGTITADEETMNDILCGNANALLKAIKKNGFEVNGESYIPANEERESDVDFDFIPTTLLIEE
jgi:hypothetical protein